MMSARHRRDCILGLSVGLRIAFFPYRQSRIEIWEGEGYKLVDAIDHFGCGLDDYQSIDNELRDGGN